MLRKATQDDLPALVALRCKAARTNRTDAAGWLQNVAGLENILLLVKSGAPPAAMLARRLALRPGRGAGRPARPSAAQTAGKLPAGLWGQRL